MANLLKKQGFYNSIILYAGTGLGFFNLVILFQRFLTIQEIGFFTLMITTSLLYAQISSFGINNIIIKYFPYYRTEDKKHAGFITFIIIWCATGFLVLTLLFVVFKDTVINYYRNDKGLALLVKYYYYLIPVSFLTMLFSVLESVGSTIFKNVLPAFLREVFLRVFTFISIMLIAFSVIDYHQFLLIYIAANAAVVLILWFNIYRGKDFKLQSVSKRIHGDKRMLMKYGLFTMLSSSSFVLIQNLDVMMLTTLTRDLRIVGIYGTFFTIAVVISLPSKALSRTSLQIISQSWAINDLAKISRIYYKTSVVQMLIGCLLFIGIIVNQRFIIMLLHKTDFVNYFDVFIVVGAAFLVDMTGGLNGYILNVSKYYKWTTYIIGSTVIFCAAANWILIPHLGMIGAGIAYFLAMFFLNFAYWLFLKVKFGLQPFGKAHVLLLLVALATFFAGYFIPVITNTWFDMIVRSGVVAAIYISLIYFLNISEDINPVIDKVLRRKVARL